MSQPSLRAKQVKLNCKQCSEESIVAINREGLHAFICPYCGQPHLLLIDPNLGVRDFRQVSSVPARRPFDIARIRVKDESLIPVTLKPFWEMLKRGILPPNLEDGLAALQALGLLEIEGE
ncbi:MAG: hypothetical protein NZ954_05415 [Thermofilaceae archaeon]|nr:hypothetical protein [Thermofilaceae archaeon]MCX8180994.1 hypothetical protein [Thermofilaceae archaeon]MDW8004099.1 hypothetical protein [Thermofilaceae archaeon]